MFGMTGFKCKRNFANWDKLGKTYRVLSFVGGTVGLLQRSVSHFLFKSIANETDRFCRVRTIWKSKHPKMESKKSNNSAQINRNPAKDQCLAPLKKAIQCFCVRRASQKQKHLLLISTIVVVLKGKKKPQNIRLPGPAVQNQLYWVFVVFHIFDCLHLAHPLAVEAHLQVINPDPPSTLQKILLFWHTESMFV